MFILFLPLGLAGGSQIRLIKLLSVAVTFVLGDSCVLLLFFGLRTPVIWRVRPSPAPHRRGLPSSR
jgi:hypothetical protein